MKYAGLLKKVLALSCSLTLIAGVIGYAGAAPSTAYAAEQGVAKEYETLFTKDKIIDVKVTISDDDWQSILANPLEKEYKSVTVDVDGHVLTNVGFSTKGNLTLKAVASMTDSDRYSFRLKFNKYDKSQTLLGLDKMVLNNSYSDPSFLREYLHYEALRAIGADVPETVFTNLYINGELYGFYIGVESVDDSYLERNFGENATKGVLYDTDEGSYLQYDENSDYDTITKETGKSDNKASLKNFIKVLNEMPAGQKGDIESVLDVDSALKYIAANAVLGNYDSYNGDKGHNYLLYGNTAGKYTVIPWDMNMSFNGYSTGGGSTVTDAVYNEGETGSTIADNTDAVTASVDNPTLGMSIEKLPLINNLLKVPEYKAKYVEYVTQLVHYLEGIQDRVSTLSTLIRPYVEADPTKFYTMEQFESNITYSATESGTGGTTGGGAPGTTPPDGTAPGGGTAPPDGTAPGDGTTTPPEPPSGGIPGQEGGADNGQGMGTMAAGSMMTFALNRLVNLQGQLGLPLTALPENPADTTDPGNVTEPGNTTEPTNPTPEDSSSTDPDDNSSSVSDGSNGSTDSSSDTSTDSSSASDGSSTSSSGTSTSSSTSTDSTSGQTNNSAATKPGTVSSSTTAAKKAGEITVLINGTEVSFKDQLPVMKNGRVLVPVNAVLTAMGASVSWNSSSKQVTVNQGSTTITLTIGSNKAYVNGTAYTLDVPVQLISNRTMVPVRFVAEILNMSVAWDKATSTVTITPAGTVSAS
ncbi:CotH kinase family protein [Paenibacillus sp. HN-1]|uniref:CotH kinase family protein n=1 Tax=Paenibacillus TaxID=44249 RepID=UPI001CA7B6E5|nr:MULTISPECIES: CotH kinase family protein [Paenibacillus]MBY9077554.1 CotH kinase family protein [Paenibacillus sp. CGMCC 1.18879]MBY9087825.1 CotH kinase family protein [Paenibacillus sinensis]